MNLHQLHSILRQVQKPSQYLGNEVNAVHKDFNACQVRVALIFPDAYEIGMSHMGLRILYDILNKRKDVVAERAFAPLPDLEKALRANNLSLFSLESKTPLNEFDVIGISLPHELSYTNILNILDMSGIPVFEKDRKAHHPLILGGGSQCYNPEPLADFFDAIAIGDGEELVQDVVNAVSGWKEKQQIEKISQNKNKKSREELFKLLTSVEGIYVPKYFEPVYYKEGALKEIKSLKKNYQSVKKRVVSNLNQQPYPTELVVPNARLVHDRVGVEIQRGCARSCRFCQAGFVERPVRQRDPSTVLKLIEDSIEKTGMDEVSLLSLSAGDYQNIVPLMKNLNKCYKDQKVSISVPATRTETLTEEMVHEISKVRKTGFTIAPEAGSERLRRVINKGNRTEDLYQACNNAFKNGYRLIKFYYMLGLPFEEDNDLVGIADEVNQAYQIGRQYNPSVNINVGLSPFVPKPFTPFQWETQVTLEEAKRRLHLIKRDLRFRAIHLKTHNLEMNYLEGLFSRGDRKLSRLILSAHKNGCRFDQWREYFNFSKWQQSIDECEIDSSFYTQRKRTKDEVLPWDHLYSQFKKPWLWNEYQKAKEEAFTADCSVTACQGNCGACDFEDVKNRIYEEGHLCSYKPTLQRKDTKEPSFAKALEGRHRLRVRFAKTGPSIFFGHIELMGILKRAIMRNEFPVAFTEGFHPQMKLSMGMALSLGIESEWEYFDLTFSEKVQPNVFIQKMNESLPSGISILSAELVDLRAPSIYSNTSLVKYKADLSNLDSNNLVQVFNDALKRVLEGPEIIIERRQKKTGKVKKININKYLDAKSVKFIDKRYYCFSLKCDDEGSLKPTEVLTALMGITGNEIYKIPINKVGVILKN